MDKQERAKYSTWLSGMSIGIAVIYLFPFFLYEYVQYGSKTLHETHQLAHPAHHHFHLEFFPYHPSLEPLIIAGAALLAALYVAPRTIDRVRT